MTGSEEATAAGDSKRDGLAGSFCDFASLAVGFEVGTAAAAVAAARSRSWLCSAAQFGGVLTAVGVRACLLGAPPTGGAIVAAVPAGAAAEDAAEA